MSSFFYLVILIISIKTAKCKIFERKGYEDDLYIELNLIQREGESKFRTPDKNWVATALRDISYYLRNHKYNDWDRRYYQEKPDKSLIGFYNQFPMPPLRALHWKVSENCNLNFHKCIGYLHSIIKTAPLTRDDDIVTIVNRRQILMNETFSKQLHSECKDTLIYSEKSGAPFDGPTEKFQWRSTAIYYMCWYTMLEEPDLSILGEACDNHANCLDPEFGPHNKDPRSDDRLFFACAMYSFCPDLCCPIKHLKEYNECYNAEMNPCYAENYNRNPVERTCLIDRKDNRNFIDIVRNRWNVTCSCQNDGFIWKSEYSMCVDINECTTRTHTCDDESEDCLNLPGKFMCICKWGFKYDDNLKRCRKRNLFYKSDATNA